MGKKTEAYLQGTVEPKIDTIDGFHDVPAQDAATNSQARDVLGNKRTQQVEILWWLLQKVMVRH